jgi:hypothetical protein
MKTKKNKIEKKNKTEEKEEQKIKRNITSF